MMKAVSSTELGMDTLTLPAFEEMSTEEIIEHLHVQDSERAFCVYEALKRGVPHKTIYDITKIDWWFFGQDAAPGQHGAGPQAGRADQGKVPGSQKVRLPGTRPSCGLSGADKLPVENYRAGFKMVDTCAAEFAAKTPYFYSTYDGGQRGRPVHCRAQRPQKKEGPGLWLRPHPHRSGHRVRLLLGPCGLDAEKARLRGHPRQQQPRNRLHRLRHRRPPLLRSPQPRERGQRHRHRKARRLPGAVRRPDAPSSWPSTWTRSACPILGTPADAIDEAEDRERFDELLERCGIPRPEGRTVFTLDEALKAAQEVGLPGSDAPLLRAGRPEHDRGLQLRRRHRVYGRHHRPMWICPTPC